MLADLHLSQLFGDEEQQQQQTTATTLNVNKHYLAIVCQVLVRQLTLDTMGGAAESRIAAMWTQFVRLIRLKFSNKAASSSLHGTTFYCYTTKACFNCYLNCYFCCCC